MNVPTHTEPVKIAYPGGKDGWYRVDCSEGDYSAVEPYPQYAIRRVKAHIHDKHLREPE